MTYPDDKNGDVFRRMERHGFDFSKEHVVDFHAVMATEEEADKVARMFVADHKAGQKLEDIETKPHEVGGMRLDLAKRMILTHESVTAFESLLAERVSQFDGYLDGWGVMQQD
jgi:regulator of RNase E activity RraB